MTETAVVETTETTETTETAPVESAPLLSKVETKETVETKPAASWPDDWRERYAKGDEKKLKQLERYSSVEAALDSTLALKQKLSRGEFQKVLGDNPTPEELKEWREANGVPEKPEEYKLELGDGRMVGEQDKPLLDAFLKRVHSENMPEKDVNRAVKAWYEIQDEQIRQRKAADTQFEQEAVNSLTAEYGDDFDRNMIAATSLLDQAPEGVKDLIASARTQDGHILGSDPNVIRWIVQIARELNPRATLVGGISTRDETGIAARKAALQKMMGDYSSDYWKGPNAANLQKEYNQLLSAEAGLKKRA